MWDSISGLTNIQKDYIPHLPFMHEAGALTIGGDQTTKGGLSLHEANLTVSDNSFVL